MKTIFIVFLAVVASITQLVAQSTFYRTYGGANDDFGYTGHVIQTQDGGYAMVGVYYSDSTQPGALIRTDSNGDTLWVQRTATFPYFVEETNDGGFAVGAAAGILQKYDANGVHLWTKFFINFGTVRSLVEMNNGDLCFVGQGNPPGGGTGSYFMTCRTDFNGNVIWSRAYGNDTLAQHCSNGYYSSKILLSNDSSFTILGFSNAPTVNGLIIQVLRITSSGAIMWNRSYDPDTTRLDLFGLIDGEITTDNGVMILGSDTYNGAGLLIRTDSSGNLLWANEHFGNISFYAYGICSAPGNNFILTGEEYNWSAATSHAAVIQIDSAGNSIWTKNYEGFGSWGELGMDVTLTSDNGYAIMGYTDSYGAGMSDMFLLRTDSIGNTACSQVAGIDSVVAIVPVVLIPPLEKIVFTQTPVIQTGPIACPLIVTDPCLNMELPEVAPDYLIGPTPNPANDNVVFELIGGNEIEITLLTIFDLNGRVVMQNKIARGESQLTLSTSELDAGVYSCVFQQEDGSVITRSLVIVKY